MYNDFMRNILILILFILFLMQCTDKKTNVNRSPSITENRLRIAVLDTGISKRQFNEKYMCKDMPYFSIRSKGLDWHGHGTNIVGLIGERINTKKYCITIYAFGVNPKLSETNYYLSEMLNHGVVGVNLSIQGEDYDMTEGDTIKKLTDSHIKVFVASGNSKFNLNIKCNTYPACHKLSNRKLIVIGSTDRRYSNYGRIVDKYIDGTKKGYPVMSGTSMSTAIATGLHFSK